ncbi:DUF6415 family natural product biosynthesis protein [Streptomyces sp. NPDC048281]|uniref:DUF6415 family natural product biosynthesis protein n=1 Tax=Streptomyces sp. NPDC048281 TaxID=3154715 RepID=UPI00343C6A90
MAEAASSGTATTLKPAPTCVPGTGDAIDAEVIRETYDAVLWAPWPVPEGDRARIGGLLRGHVQLLIPELTHVAPRLNGAWRDTADHVLVSSRGVLAGVVGTSQDDLHTLATQCRALLLLRTHAAPLTCLMPRTTEGRP